MMANIDSIDYHDFVIKDKKLVAEFDQMYEKALEIPWHQDEQEGATDIRLLIDILEEYSPFSSIHDFGCGLGYFLDVLGRKFNASECKLLGYDISASCCKKAKVLFPRINFIEMDLKQSGYRISKDSQKRSLLVLRSVLWYVYQDIDDIVKNLEEVINGKDILAIVQSFPPLDSDFVGKEIFPSCNSIIQRFEEYFTPLKWLWLEDNVLRVNDNWFIGIFQKRKGERNEK